MRRIIGLAVTLSFVFAGALFGQEADQPAGPSAERISELIQQLDAEKAEVREAATEELRKIGEPALKALEKVLADPPSVEVKFRAQAAIDGIKLELIRNQALKVDDILAQARAAQKEGWDRKALDAQLNRLIEVLARETGKPDLKLPTAGTGGPVRGPFAEGAFIKEKRVRLAHCQRSIILADTIASVSHADNCVIIGRQAVCVAHSTNCILIAGQILDVSHAHGSVLLCNSETIVSHARDSMLAGPGGLEVSSAYGTTYLNAAAPMQLGRLPDRMANTSVNLQGLRFGPKANKNPLEGKLMLTLAIDRDEPVALFKLPDGRGEYVARFDQEIRTPEGKPLDEVKGWRLVHAGYRLAIFENGEQIACVRGGM